jgi:hypothetical protein
MRTSSGPANYAVVALALPSKGLICGTVPGVDAELAMRRTPLLPGIARAFLMHSSSAGAI